MNNLYSTVLVSIETWLGNCAISNATATAEPRSSARPPQNDLFSALPAACKLTIPLAPSYSPTNDHSIANDESSDYN